MPVEEHLAGRGHARSRSPHRAQLPPDRDAPWLQFRQFRDEHPWKFNEDATAFAEELRTADWASADGDAGRAAVKAGLRVLQLETSLVDDYQAHGRNLLTRAPIRQLWDMALHTLKTDPQIRKIAMIGNPGIGKSRSLLYGLRLLMGGSSPDRESTGVDSPTVVIFQATADRTFFALVPPGQDLRNGEKNTAYHVYSVALEDFKAANCMVLKQSETFYLIDPGKARGKQPTAVRAKTILACSTDPEHYKEWIKAMGMELYFPVWEEAEVLAALPYMAVPPDVTDIVVNERFCEFGGIPRIIFGSLAVVDKHGEARDGQLKDAAMISDIIGGSPLETVRTRNRIPTYLFAYRATDPFTFRSRKVGFISLHARNAIFAKHYDKMVALAADPTTPRCVNGFSFEDFCGWLLTRAATGLQWEEFPLWCSRMAPDSTEWVVDPKGFKLPQQPLQWSEGTEKDMDEKWKSLRASATSDTVLHTPRDYTAVDYLLGFDKGVDATVGSKKVIAPKLKDKLNMLELHPEQFTLIFLVPSTVFDTIKVDRQGCPEVPICKVSVPMHADWHGPVSAPTVRKRPAVNKKPAAGKGP